jgi:hypothetical protein
VSLKGINAEFLPLAAIAMDDEIIIQVPAMNNQPNCLLILAERSHIYAQWYSIGAQENVPCSKPCALF